MNDQPIYLTKEGLDRVEAELRHLKAEKRPELADRLEKAKELGDLRENADYQEAKDELGRMESRIMELEDMVRRVKIITSDGRDVVSIGGKVTVASGGKEKSFTIVGSKEADPPKGLISNESPLGVALLGKRVGESAEIDAPSGKVTYSVVSIS